MASAGASAALAGLVIVAVSINVERILRFEGLPERALATVLLLLGVVLVSLVGLVPGQSPLALGIELLAVGVLLASVIFRLTARHEADTRAHARAYQLLVALGTVPSIVGALSLIAETGGGLYWVAGGIVAAIAAGVANAWVLLVEILR